MISMIPMMTIMPMSVAAHVHDWPPLRVTTLSRLFRMICILAHSVVPCPISHYSQCRVSGVPGMDRTAAKCGRTGTTAQAQLTALQRLA